MTITIRDETPSDIAAVRTVNERAFGTPEEACIVDAIRSNCDDIISLVAEADGAVVGHILFSPADIRGASCAMHGFGLAPMAVMPERQNQGIGSLLVRAGLERLRAQGCPFVIVLGHPDYYPRFGFTPASAAGIACQWPGVPDEAFMLLSLDEEATRGISGTAYYRDEFDAAMGGGND
jgi:putative acetyltransferase